MQVDWEGEMRYRAAREGGASMLVDGSRTAAPSPVDALLGALAACAAIDVVEILEKRRTPPTALRVRAEATRAPTHPRRVTHAKLRFRVATASERVHVERAIQLSIGKYCSVAASLALDSPLEWELELDGAGTPA